MFQNYEINQDKSQQLLNKVKNVDNDNDDPGDESLQVKTDDESLHRDADVNGSSIDAASGGLHDPSLVEEVALVEALSHLHHTTTTDNFLVQFSCQGAGGEGGEGDWQLCGGEEHRAEASTHVMKRWFITGLYILHSLIYIMPFLYVVLQYRPVLC